MQPRRLEWSIDPCEALECWPRSRPLAALISRGGAPLGRWSIFGVADEWSAVRGTLDDPRARQAEWRAMLTALAGACRRERSASLPFHGGWIGFLCYELGALFEPSALPQQRVLKGLPLAGGWRCSDAVIHDAVTDSWWWTGEGDAPLDLTRVPSPSSESARIVDLVAEQPSGTFTDAVATVRERIHAGDLYQANVSQRWRGRLIGCPRRLAATAIRTSGARYGAVIEMPEGGAVISMSPELFLQVDANGAVVTRPIKGTWPSDRPAQELLASEKDAAELAMIVDLMRNDLARVCQPGSVRVTTPRIIETHPTVHHGVAEIRGQLRPDANAIELLAATFPPGSVTGAPKVAAMRIIDALEPEPRGPYCGAVGFIEHDGSMALNVAIRTITLLPQSAIDDAEPAQATDSARAAKTGATVSSTDDFVHTFVYSAGCGIVSDSVPLEEAAESLLKCRVLERTAAALESASVSAPASASASTAAAASFTHASAPTPREAVAGAVAPRS